MRQDGDAVTPGSHKGQPAGCTLPQQRAKHQADWMRAAAPGQAYCKLILPPRARGRVGRGVCTSMCAGRHLRIHVAVSLGAHDDGRARLLGGRETRHICVRLQYLGTPHRLAGMACECGGRQCMHSSRAASRQQPTQLPWWHHACHQLMHAEVQRRPLRDQGRSSSKVCPSTGPARMHASRERRALPAASDRLCTTSWALGGGGGGHLLQAQTSVAVLQVAGTPHIPQQVAPQALRHVYAAAPATLGAAGLHAHPALPGPLRAGQGAGSADGDCAMTAPVQHKPAWGQAPEPQPGQGPCWPSGLAVGGRLCVGGSDCGVVIACLHIAGAGLLPAQGNGALTRPEPLVLRQFTCSEDACGCARSSAVSAHPCVRGCVAGLHLLDAAA